MNIYGLFGHDGRLRYIGKANDPAARLASHLRDSRRRQTPLYAWIRKHGCPAMRLLEANCADWREAERRLIAEARARGDDLLNIADGGDEPHCSVAQRAENGRANAAKLHANPRARRVWELKKAIGTGLKRGYVSDQAKATLRLAAARATHLFGAWANI